MRHKRSMRGALLLLGLSAAVAMSSVVLDFTAVRPAHAENGADNPTAPVLAAAKGARDSPEFDPVAQTSTTPVTTAREALPAPVAETPCDSVTLELSAERAARAAAEADVAALREELAAARRDLDRLQYPEGTPYGAFLASFEADYISDPYVLERIEDWLRQFPVVLRPGEATWIANRTTASDWKLYARTSELALIQFLGPARLLAELPPERVTELRTHYEDEPIFD